MPDPDQPPDVYTDQFIMTTTVWGTALSFLRMPPHPTPTQPPQAVPQVVVRMSLQHAKAMAMIMRRQLKKWERDNIEIQFPSGALNQMGLSPEDW